MDKPTLSIDFDETIINNKTQDPMPGAGDALRMLSRKYKIVVLTARDEAGQRQAKVWLREQLGLNIPVTNIKEHAVAYIDDHGYKFTSWLQVLKDF